MCWRPTASESLFHWCTSFKRILERNGFQGFHHSFFWLLELTGSEVVQHALRLVSSPNTRTLRLFLLAQQKEELCCCETVVEAFTCLLWEKSYTYLRLKKNALLLWYSRRQLGTRAHTSLATLQIYTQHPHPVSRYAMSRYAMSRYANHPTTFSFSLNFIDFFIAQEYMYSRMSFKCTKKHRRTTINSSSQINIWKRNLVKRTVNVPPKNQDEQFKSDQTIS